MTIFSSLVVSYFLREVMLDHLTYHYNLPPPHPGSSWTLLQSCACYPFIPIAVITYHAMSFFMSFITEEEIATHCSILAWKIPWTEEPGGLHFMGLQRIWHNWAYTHLFYSLMYFQLSKLTPEHNWCSILIWSMNKQMLVKKKYLKDASWSCSSYPLLDLTITLWIVFIYLLFIHSPIQQYFLSTARHCWELGIGDEKDRHGLCSCRI